MNDSKTRYFSPAVTVIIPVFNGSRTLRSSIDSILDQSWTDFELIVIDDASSDESREIIRSINDSRLRAFFNESNMGLARTLDVGIALARGKYIIRQDQDDISHANRIARQINFLDKNSSTILLGSRARVMLHSNHDTEGIFLKSLKHPICDSSLRWLLLFSNPFVHSSTAFRKIDVERVGGYTSGENYSLPEDYQLWSRLIHHGKVANLKDSLVDYYESDQGMSRVKLEEIEQGVARIALQNLKSLSQTTKSQDDAWIYVVLALNGFRRDRSPLILLLHGLWLLTKTAILIGRSGLEFELIKIWFLNCSRLIQSWIKSRFSTTIGKSEFR